MLCASDRGEVVLQRPLDYEAVQSYSFTVTVADGRGQEDSCQVNISVVNVNDWDPRFKYPQYEFFVRDAAAAPGTIVGAVEVFDGDTGDEVSLQLAGHGARVFGITEAGEIFIRDLGRLSATEAAAHLVVTAEDSGSPPRRASVPVTVTFESLGSGGGGGGARELVGGAGPDMVLVIVLVAVSCVFLLVTVSLATVICRTKQRLKAASPELSSDTDSMYLQQHSGQFPAQVPSPVTCSQHDLCLLGGLGQPELQAGPVPGEAQHSAHQTSLRSVRQVSSPGYNNVYHQ